jgi:hypothetical protein
MHQCINASAINTDDMHHVVMQAHAWMAGRSAGVAKQIAALKSSMATKIQARARGLIARAKLGRRPAHILPTRDAIDSMVSSTAQRVPERDEDGQLMLSASGSSPGEPIDTSALTKSTALIRAHDDTVIALCAVLEEAVTESKRK